MQFVRYSTGGSPAWGVRRADGIVPRAGLREMVASRQLTDPGLLNVVENVVDAAADKTVRASDVRLLAF